MNNKSWQIVKAGMSVTLIISLFWLLANEGKIRAQVASPQQSKSMLYMEQKRNAEGKFNLYKYYDRDTKKFIYVANGYYQNYPVSVSVVDDNR